MLEQGYVKGLLSTGEVVLIDTRQHWMAAVRFVLRPILLIVLAALFALFNQAFPIQGTLRVINDLAHWAMLVLLVVGIVWLLIDLARWWSRHYILTNRRAMRMEGILRKRSFDSSLEQIDDIRSEQTFLGRMLGYSDLTLYTASETPHEVYAQLLDGLQFKKAVLDAKEAIRGGAPLQELPPGFIVKGGTNEASMRADGKITEAAAQATPPQVPPPAGVAADGPTDLVAAEPVSADLDAESAPSEIPAQPAREDQPVPEPEEAAEPDQVEGVLPAEPDLPAATEPWVAPARPERSERGPDDEAAMAQAEWDAIEEAQREAMAEAEDLMREARAPEAPVAEGPAVEPGSESLGEEPEPEAIEPEPEVIEPEVIEPEVVEPEPEVIEPEVVEPELEVVEPEPEPEAIEPEVIEPEPEVIEPTPAEEEPSDDAWTVPASAEERAPSPEPGLEVPGTESEPTGAREPLPGASAGGEILEEREDEAPRGG